MTTTTTRPTPADDVVLDRLPSWATEHLIEDGYVYSKRTITTTGGELVQASQLFIDEATGTVRYRPGDLPTIWLPDGCVRGLSVQEARAALQTLLELLPLLEGCAAAGGAA